MSRFFCSAIIVCMVSMYFFPVEFSFLPGINTKMMLALGGALCYGLSLAENGHGEMDKRFFLLSICASVFSLICYGSTVYNNTPDTVYASYLVSMWVWMGGAFFVCKIIRKVHGTVGIEVVAQYLIAVCVLQCILSQIIHTQPHVKDFVDRWILQNQAFLNRYNVKRLYGIGASLDVAGTRFSAVLVMITHLLISNRKITDFKIVCLIISFMVIFVLGSIIARTTYVGLILSVIYILAHMVVRGHRLPGNSKKITVWFSIIFVLSFFLCAIIYQNSPSFNKNIRFAFEGFVNLIEKGQWIITSNDKLMSMVVWPDNLKTWLIGDGYFNNPFVVDENYIGRYVGGYYMGTDIGYCRFLFYCGIFGFSVFALFFILTSHCCIEKFSRHKLLFLVLLLEVFIVWAKVSTDIFLVFALFLCSDTPIDDSVDEIKSIDYA